MLHFISAQLLLSRSVLHAATMHKALCMLQGVDEDIVYALSVLKELMPHVNVQRQMTEEQQMWLTFSALVQGGRKGASRTAA
jgi:hypothetical protein